MATIRCTWVCRLLLPLIRPADTFSLGEKAARRRRTKVPRALGCSNEFCRSNRRLQMDTDENGLLDYEAGFGLEELFRLFRSAG